MITRALIAACVALAFFAGVQTLKLSWAREALSEADQAATEAALEKAKLAGELASALRDQNTARDNLANDIVREIENGSFANADAPLDPALADQLNRLRFGVSTFP